MPTESEHALPTEPLPHGLLESTTIDVTSVPVVPSLRDEYDHEAVPQRRIILPALLFLATCATTFWAGVYQWEPTFLGIDGGIHGNTPLRELFLEHWDSGLEYMGAVMAILLCHEMGHFLLTLRYRVPASLPYFIPLPVMLTGTMGAVIGMQGSRADRKQMFDIGLAGPLAGLAVTIPFLWFGIRSADYSVVSGGIHFGDPLLVKLLIPILRPGLPAGAELLVNPFYMAAWVGLLVTGLNMLPIGQLDGGHVAYAVLGKRAHVLARGLLLTAIGFIVVFDQFNWILMVMLVMFIGTDHPNTADDTVPLGWGRRALGLASLAIPVLCFTPFPVY
ncbi:MAG: site-2 protease family protein [Pirellulales bacterium]